MRSRHSLSTEKRSLICHCGQTSGRKVFPTTASGAVRSFGGGIPNDPINPLNDPSYHSTLSVIDAARRAIIVMSLVGLFNNDVRRVSGPDPLRTHFCDGSLFAEQGASARLG